MNTNDGPKQTQWIIILGYGRSGSTWLELNIVKRMRAHMLGEFFLIDDPNSHCSCGAAIKDCDYWRDFLQLNHDVRVEKLALGGTYTDSSKSSHGAIRHLIALLHNKDLKLVPIICFRNPVHVMRSAEKGSNRLLRKGIEKKDKTHWLRFILTWPLSYVIAFLFCLFIFKRPEIVDFDNERSVQQALEKFEADRDIKQTKNDHIIEGNRLIADGLLAWRKPKDIWPLSIKEGCVHVLLLPVYLLLKALS